jgi:hypothetical protein
MKEFTAGPAISSAVNLVVPAGNGSSNGPTILEPPVSVFGADGEKYQRSVSRPFPDTGRFEECLRFSPGPGSRQR